MRSLLTLCGAVVRILNGVGIGRLVEPRELHLMELCPLGGFLLVCTAGLLFAPGSLLNHLQLTLGLEVV